MRIIFYTIISSLILISCGYSKEEKEEALKSFVIDNYVFADTTLVYELKSSNLILTFPNGTNFKEWEIHGFLMHDSSDQTIFLGRKIYEVVDNTITIKNVGIKEYEYDDYYVDLDICPTSMVLTYDNSFHQGIPMRSYTTNEISLYPQWKGREYKIYDLNILKDMDKELKEYCANHLRETFKKWDEDFSKKHKIKTIN